jgi:hypothetical protein
MVGREEEEDAEEEKRKMLVRSGRIEGLVMK